MFFKKNKAGIDKSPTKFGAGDTVYHIQQTFIKRYMFSGFVSENVISISFEESGGGFGAQSAFNYYIPVREGLVFFIPTEHAEFKVVSLNFSQNIITLQRV